MNRYTLAVSYHAIGTGSTFRDKLKIIANEALHRGKLLGDAPTRIIFESLDAASLEECSGDHGRAPHERE